MAPPDPMGPVGRGPDPPGAPGVPVARPLPPPVGPRLRTAQPLPASPRIPPAAQPIAAGPSPGPTHVLPARPLAALSTAAVPRGAEEDPQPDPDGGVAHWLLKDAPPFLASAVIHMVALIVFALIANQAMPPRAIELEVETVYSEQLGLQTAIESPLGTEDSDKLEMPVITPPNLREVDEPFAAPAKLEIHPSGVTMASTEMKAGPIGLALTGRQVGSKRNLLGKFGGNDTTEAAVERGLAWLARYQLPNGSWSLTGRYGDGADVENAESATAMALLAFQGAGHTHQAGEYRELVRRAWTWLLSRQGASGDFYHSGTYNHRFYTHAQCTIALCELYAMTRDSAFHAPAYRAVQYCVDSQAPDGGWKYFPKAAPGDLSVTGWVVMALQSARMAGLDVPDDTLRKIKRFLDDLATNDGTRYPYQAGDAPRRSMTAEGMLCRQWLGWPRTDKRLVSACEWLTLRENLVNFRRDRDVYYWYYATQLCHHMEGKYWEKWNAEMRQTVPERQEKRGPEAGSWDPLRPTEDKWAMLGGRLYTTCLSIYMLEVYYRHLPIYSSSWSPGVAAEETSRPAADKPKP